MTANVFILSGSGNNRQRTSAQPGRNGIETLIFFVISQILKTTEKMLSVWAEVGATGAKLNSFR